MMFYSMLLVLFICLLAILWETIRVYPEAIVRFLLRFASVYRHGHILHADGSPYMERYSLFETPWLGCRLHYIVTADSDRCFHDHPWTFVSLLISGGYLEVRPYSPTKPLWVPGPDGEEVEIPSERYRGAPSLAFRRPTDRHLISHVEENTWSLFFYGPPRQWWGFYPRSGKIHWFEYNSVHKTAQSEEERRQREGSAT